LSYAYLKVSVSQSVCQSINHAVSQSLLKVDLQNINFSFKMHIQYHNLRLQQVWYWNYRMVPKPLSASYFLIETMLWGNAEHGNHAPVILTKHGHLNGY